MHFFALGRCCPSVQVKGGGSVGHRQLPRQQGSSVGTNPQQGLVMRRGEKQSHKRPELLGAACSWYPALGSPSSSTGVCKPGLISIALVQTQGLEQFVLCRVPFFHISGIFNIFNIKIPRTFSLLGNSEEPLLSVSILRSPHGIFFFFFLLNFTCYRPKAFYSFA